MNSIAVIIIGCAFAFILSSCQFSSPQEKSDLTQAENKISRENRSVKELYQQDPYTFDTTLKNGYHLSFRYFLDPTDSLVNKMIALKKGKSTIDTLNVLGALALHKNLGYIRSDFQDYFVFAESFGGGNPEKMKLIRKADGKVMRKGYMIDADEKNEILLFAHNADSIMCFDMKKQNTLFLGDRNKLLGSNIYIHPTYTNLRIHKVTPKNIFVEFEKDSELSTIRKYER